MASEISSQIMSKVENWLNGNYDEETKSTLREWLKNDPSKLIDAFSSDLSFGTGGLRGIVGPGTNRLNIYTIRKATQGLANYLKIHYPDSRISVVIGYDNRIHSALFAKETARVLAGNKIHVWLTSALRPTPFISFACRYKYAKAAVMITASHNPPEYNGYKVYGSDGAQVSSPQDTEIINEVKKISSDQDIFISTEHDPLIALLTDAEDIAYIEAIRPLAIHPSINQKQGHQLHIVYSNLHGTGITLLPRALHSWGFSSVHLVKEQQEPDGLFTTTPNPNPEEKSALTLGIRDLLQKKADLFIATDPDADRLAVVSLFQGEPFIFTGNQIATICLHYLLKEKSSLRSLSHRDAVVSTIVTTPLLQTMAKSYDVHYVEVLTGFKYIGEVMRLWENTGNPYKLLLGAEESLGYLHGSHARDKDAISSACLISEIALSAKNRGTTLVDYLLDIYFQYGIYAEKQLSIEYPSGQEGLGAMRLAMQNLRENSNRSIVGDTLIRVDDYLSQQSHDMATKNITPLHLHADVVTLHFQSGKTIIIRPSGTEPKIKIYGMYKASSGVHPLEDLKHAERELLQFFTHIKKVFFS